MDIERSGKSVEAYSADDPTIDRTIIPAAPRTTVIGRMSLRRRWTVEQKLAMVAAAYVRAASVQQVADRFEIFPAQIYNLVQGKSRISHLASALPHQHRSRGLAWLKHRQLSITVLLVPVSSRSGWVVKLRSSLARR